MLTVNRSDSDEIDSFLWRKKYGLSKDAKSENISPTIRKLHKRQLEKNKKELREVKKRRSVTADKSSPFGFVKDEIQSSDMLMHETKLAELWHKGEEEFFLKQVKERSRIRLECQRPQPIDTAAAYVNAFSVVLDVIWYISNNPLKLINRLTFNELEDFFEDIKIYQKVDQENLEYWKIMASIVRHKLDSVSQRRQLNDSVEGEMNNVFSGKTKYQLEILRANIKTKIIENDNIDISYWEDVLAYADYQIAMLDANEIIQRKIESVLSKVAMKTTTDSKAHVSKSVEQLAGTCHHKCVAPVSDADLKQTSLDIKSKIDEVREVDLVYANDVTSKCDYEVGSYSPKLLQQGDLDVGTVVIEPSMDWENLLKARSVVLDNIKRDSMRVSGVSHISLSDKFIPKKPKFHNRVISGFVWNKYNRTHYDLDNPPPKCVRGYKFDIFYPDLIDTTKIPTYSIAKCDGNNSRLAVLTFHSGPPYEDIAFKIVDDDWDFSKRRGFCCQCERKTFHLWFNFRRYIYRR